MTLPFRLGRGGTTLAVRVTPKATDGRVLGLGNAANANNWNELIQIADDPAALGNHLERGLKPWPKRA